MTGLQTCALPIYGHVHLNYGAQRPRILQRGDTTIINAYERYILDLPDEG